MTCEEECLMDFFFLEVVMRTHNIGIHGELEEIISKLSPYTP